MQDLSMERYKEQLGLSMGINKMQQQQFIKICSVSKNKKYIDMGNHKFESLIKGLKSSMNDEKKQYSNEKMEKLQLSHSLMPNSQIQVKAKEVSFHVREKAGGISSLQNSLIHMSPSRKLNFEQKINLEYKLIFQDNFFRNSEKNLQETVQQEDQQLFTIGDKMSLCGSESQIKPQKFERGRFVKTQNNFLIKPQSKSHSNKDINIIQHNKKTIKPKKVNISLQDQQKAFIKTSISFNHDLFEKDQEDQEGEPEPVETQDVYILPSVFKDRPPTIFFQYPKDCLMTRDLSRAIKLQPQEVQRLELTYKVPQDTPYRCVVNAFAKAGFTRTRDCNWYCYWGFLGQESQKLMVKHQKTNHFPGCWNLGRKDKLWQHLSFSKRKHPQEFNYIPNTFLMQTEFERIKSVIQDSKKNDIFIMKPVASACGRGIKLITKKSKLKKNNNYLVQEYQSSPHLINGLKYDLRIYVLVTSFDPLKIYVYKDGLCRFATEQYDTKKLKHKFSHLTNYSINKMSKNFVKNTKSTQDDVGSKWSLTALRKYYQINKIDDEKLFKSMHDIIIKTLISVEPYQTKGNSKSGKFELYGFDILIDSLLKPWLLEVNVCPSLSSTSPLDRKIKYAQRCNFRLISDTCHLVGFVPYNQEKLKQKEFDKKVYRKEKEKIPINTSTNWTSILDIDYKNCIDKLSSQAWIMLFEFEEENYRRGRFDRIFPIKENVEFYQTFFQFQRFNNILLHKHLLSPKPFIELISEQISDQIT